jgi:nicotinamidase-related amidase
MKIDKSDTAVVFIDPQNDVLSEKGLAWPLVHESLQENHTIENMERIFKEAKARGFEVFISPHYFYPIDKGWKFNGPLETDEATSGMFARKGVLNLDGLEGSGADWLARFKPYIQDGKTIVVAPHRVWGRRPTTSFYSCANAGSAGSFLAECWRTCASNLTCAN